MNNKYQIDGLSFQKAQKLFETEDIDKMEVGTTKDYATSTNIIMFYSFVNK